MEKTKNKKVLVALCMVSVVLCCAFIPVKSVEASMSARFMDSREIDRQINEHYNSMNTYQSARDSIDTAQWTESSWFSYCFNNMMYLYEKDVWGCYVFTRLAMINSGCNVVALEYTDGFCCVDHWKAVAFDGSRVYQTICSK